MLGERILGGIGISFPTTMSFNLEEREYLLTLASQYAQALDRIRLYEAEQQARVQLEARVLERTAELERSNRELNQFAYVASHDLKAPLRAIDHLANWITQDAGSLLPPDSAGHLARLRGRVKRMETLLDDLLAYSRAGRERHPATLVDMRLLLQETLEFLSLPAGFVVELVGPMPTIYTERIPLETVFRNLIQNSYKHHDHPNDGHVCISAQELDHSVLFTVADNGPGIAPRYHERIFEMFQTLKPRDELEGSGIGLTVVKKIVESRGGSLRVESAEGAGATFFITWPKQARATGGAEG
jgi:signal transduction histidine kinase